MDNRTNKPPNLAIVLLCYQYLSWELSHWLYCAACIHALHSNEAKLSSSIITRSLVPQLFSFVWVGKRAWWTLTAHAPNRAGIPVRLWTIVHVCNTCIHNSMLPCKSSTKLGWAEHNHKPASHYRRLLLIRMIQDLLTLWVTRTTSVSCLCE